jgi:hypothetical protein
MVRVNNIPPAISITVQQWSTQRRTALTALIIVTYRIACRIIPPTKTDVRWHSGGLVASAAPNVIGGRAEG